MNKIIDKQGRQLKEQDEETRRKSDLERKEYLVVERQRAQPDGRRGVDVCAAFERRDGRVDVNAPPRLHGLGQGRRRHHRR